MPVAGLYGITNSNRQGKNLWGKNQFNSTFPTSLACYMRDNNIDAVYLKTNKQLQIQISSLPISELFGTANKQIRFNFEERFAPYRQLVVDENRLEKIDLVTSLSGKDLRPIEVKLTVIPDSTTVKHAESKWAPELVVRPATMIYCALGIYQSSVAANADLRTLFYKQFQKIRDWTNEGEVRPYLSQILSAIDSLTISCENHQNPVLMQPIWKTEGQTPKLSENAFDIFVWSDFALTKLFMESAREEFTTDPSRPISRLQRAAVRLAAFLTQMSHGGTADIESIYRGIAYTQQTDKEFSVPGSKLHTLMNCVRLQTPIIKRSALKKIILNGGERLLKPERRFDQTIYFSSIDLF